ncbi:MAG: bifunctional serine/threonine-protein kinase/formylglycine-generating enzyme family protein [Isosphaeraceae bacterium]
MHDEKENGSQPSTSTAPPARCDQYTEADLSRWLDLQDHLDTCPVCPETIDRLTGTNNTLLEEMLGIVADPLRPTPHAPKSSGDRFRRGVLFAQGGLGDIYVAYDSEFEREVAYKQLQDRHLANQDTRRRFMDEARITGLLQHPNIVPVFSRGFDATGRPFYAMQLFRDGRTLQKVIREDHWTGTDELEERQHRLRRLVQIVAMVGEAIHYSHGCRVLHRDIKPANIMIGAFEEVVVLDWGLAKELRGGEAAESVVVASPTDSDHRASESETADGVTLGTRGYMSPEQQAGQPVGFATDIYALGATLYAVLTGHSPPSRSTTEPSVDADPRRVVADVPRALAEVTRKAMNADIQDRYESANAFVGDLQRWLAGEPVSVWREPPSLRVRRWIWRQWTLFLITTTMLAMLGILGAIQAYRIASQRDVDRTTAENLVAALETAETASVPGLVRQLASYRTWADPLLRRMAEVESDEKDVRSRFHANIALMPSEPGRVNPILAYLLRGEPGGSARPGELLLARGALANHAVELSPRLWAEIDQGPASLTDQELSAAGLLATLAPNDTRWADLGPRVAARLLRENPLLTADWSELFRPVGGLLSKHLMAASPASLNPVESNVRLSLLLNFITRAHNEQEPEDLANYLVLAGPAEFRIVVNRLLASSVSERAVQRLKAIVAGDDARPAGRDDNRRKAQALIALKELGRDDYLSRLSRRSQDNPTLRAELIHGMARLGSDPRPLILQLVGNAERDAMTRHALILALGEYPPERIPSSERAELVKRLLADYQTHPDAGLHAAADWLLRARWGFADAVRAADAELARSARSTERNWFVGPEGHVFVALRSPVSVEMGSDESQGPEGFDRFNEIPRHRVTMPRPFALTSREVTVGQFAHFLAVTYERRRDSRWAEIWYRAFRQLYQREGATPADLPGISRARDPVAGYDPAFSSYPFIGVEWNLAAAYCNWLSELEGLPESQWSYPSATQPRLPNGQPRYPTDYLQRTGYRLPTEAEWSLVARDQAGTSYPFGESEAMLPFYGWFEKNAGGGPHAVGLLKPSDFGLFDTLGNAAEWVYDPYGFYPQTDPRRPRGIPTNRFWGTTSSVVRGGSFDTNGEGPPHRTTHGHADRLRRRPSASASPCPTRPRIPGALESLKSISMSACARQHPTSATRNGSFIDTNQGSYNKSEPQYNTQARVNLVRDPLALALVLEITECSAVRGSGCTATPGVSAGCSASTTHARASTDGSGTAEVPIVVAARKVVIGMSVAVGGVLSVFCCGLVTNVNLIDELTELSTSKLINARPKVSPPLTLVPPTAATSPPVIDVPAPSSICGPRPELPLKR